ncbi:uncharacterized protein LOC130800136 [Amaranthus tricolor]|uniref:uncharacterized protein LOC130800136 n=1 Tax=Amaranthus tricolor TaxID=29722 RepID=UPI002585B737|nr:uncharacterized protein LOC130800136 [Amaranthus tricolor]
MRIDQERISIKEEDEESPTPSNAFIHRHRHRCCFHFPCFYSSPSSTTTHHIITLGEGERSTTSSSFWDRFRSREAENRWWARPFWALKKVREWSEIVAGPKWKTFIRRFNRRRHNQRHQFQYDPLSYALNFDEGQNDHFEESVALQFPDFSSRFVAASSKSPTPTESAKDFSNGAPAC